MEEKMMKESSARGIIKIKVQDVGCEIGKNLLEQAENLAEGMTLNDELSIIFDDTSKKVIAYKGMAIEENKVGICRDGVLDEKNFTAKELPDLLEDNFLSAKVNSSNGKELVCDLYCSNKQIYDVTEEEPEEITEETVMSTPKPIKKTQDNTIKPIEYKKRTKHANTIEGEIDLIVEEGILSRERLNKMVECMRGNRIGDKRILNILKQVDFCFDMEGNCVAPWEAGTLYIDANPKREPSILNECMRASLMEQHALVFVGDPSTGKNVCGETIAYCRGWQYYLFSMSAYMTKEDVYGESITDNSAGSKLDIQGAFAYLKCQYLPEQATEEEKEIASKFELYKAQAATVQIIKSYSPLVKWVHTGGVLMLNEWNMADANLKQQFLNSMLDGTKALDVPGLGLVKLHKNCMLLASENPGFTGAMADNQATKSRFGVIEFPKADECKKQLISSLGADFLREEYFDAANDYYKAVKSLVGTAEREGQISDAALNIRGLKRALEDVKRDQIDGEKASLSHAILTEVIMGCPIEDRPVLQYQLKQVVRI